jgi:hypothetical protein
VNTAARWSAAGMSAIIVSAATMRFAAPPASSAEVATSAACSDPIYRQFDFWAGDWDVFELDNPSKPVAHARITRILNGCVLLEVYEGADSHIGQSFTIYDASRNVWHQTWVTNQGGLLMIEGGMQGADMVLEGADLTRDHKQRHVRGTWRAIDGGVRETAVVSTDGGKTWNPWFDLLFRGHRPAS